MPPSPKGAVVPPPSCDSARSKPRTRSALPPERRAASPTAPAPTPCERALRARDVEGERRRRVRAQKPAASRRRVERQPAVAGKPDLDPGVGVRVGDRPLAHGPVVAAGREPRGDSRRDAEVPQHQRHRACEVLAVPAAVPGDERDERRNTSSAAAALVVRESARAEPGLERDYRRVRVPRLSDDLRARSLSS